MRIATLIMATAMGTGVAMAQQAAPPTQPTAATATPAAAPSNVLILAFDQIGGTASNYDWIGRAVQQNLQTELGRLKALQLATTSQAGSQPAADVKAAVEAGKSVGASAVIFGSFQIMEPDLRINGQVVDVATGRTLGTLKSTGTVRDLFAMEDTVATQAQRILVPPKYQPADLPLAVPATTPPPQQPIASTTPVPTTTNSYVNDYNRYTYYPNSAYGYGYYGYGGGWGYGGYWGRPYCYGGPYWYGGSSYPYVENTGFMVGRVTKPIGVGTSAGMVASGLISVPGNFLPNGQLAKK